MSDQLKPTRYAKLPPFSKEYLANEHDAKHFGEPKPTGDCTCDNASGLHWGKCPINMNTKPTGEWTGITLSRLIQEKGYKGAADAHNAALAAAKAGGWLSEEALDEYAKVEQEHRTIVDVLTDTKSALNNAGYFTPIIDAALAKVKEGK